MRLVAGQQAQAAGERSRHLGVGDLAGRLGHAVACVHARARTARAIERLRVERAAAQQDAGVARERFRLVRGHHVLQHLIDHRHVRRALLRRVGQQTDGDD